MDEKLIKKGNDWVLNVSSEMLNILDINPLTDSVEYNLFKDKLIVKKHKKTNITPLYSGEEQL